MVEQPRSNDRSSIIDRPSSAVTLATIWQLVIVVLWAGMIIAISFIEAPLKFQAPGITIPLGLGIGRLVFTVLNIVEIILLVGLTLVSFWPKVSRLTGGRMTVFVALGLLLLVKVFGVRPPLNARTDLVLAGADPGQSPWHYIYIAFDVTILILLVSLAVLTAKILARALTKKP